MITSRLGRLPATIDRSYIRFICITDLLYSASGSCSRAARAARVTRLVRFATLPSTAPDVRPRATRTRRTRSRTSRCAAPKAASKRTKLLVVGVAKTQGEARALRSGQKLESPLSQPARGGQVDRANAANRRRSRSSSGSPRRAKTEMPSSGCPSIDQACAVPETWPRSLSGVSRPPRTTSVIAAGGCSARSRSCS